MASLRCSLSVPTSFPNCRHFPLGNWKCRSRRRQQDLSTYTPTEWERQNKKGGYTAWGSLCVQIPLAYTTYFLYKFAAYANSYHKLKWLLHLRVLHFIFKSYISKYTENNSGHFFQVNRLRLDLKDGRIRISTAASLSTSHLAFFSSASPLHPHPLHSLPPDRWGSVLLSRATGEASDTLALRQPSVFNERHRKAQGTETWLSFSLKHTLTHTV